MSTTNAVPAAKKISPDKILELGFAFWGSKTLLSAIGMGLFTELADQKLTLQRKWGRALRYIAFIQRPVP